MASESNISDNIKIDNPKIEENIDELLESALQDFDSVKETELASNVQPLTNNDHTNPSSGLSLDSMNQIFEQVFNELNASNNNNVIKPETSLPHQNTMPSSSQPSKDSFSNKFNIHDDVSKTLQETLNNLNKLNLSQNNTELSNSEMTQLMAELTNDQIPGDGNILSDTMMPLMQSMMQNILSKDLLYIPLKELSAKYQEWLKENENKLGEEDKQRYTEQYKNMSSMVRLYEQERPDDSQEVKNERFERLLDLMQNMQELGTPPEDIAGDLSGLENDDVALKNLFSGNNMNPNQCPVS